MRTCRAALTVVALALAACAGGGAAVTPPKEPAVVAATPKAAPPPVDAPPPAAPPSMPPAASPALPPPPSGPELPLGGREIFPAHRLVGFCGTPGAPALGRLMGDLGAKAKAVRSYAAKYSQDRKVLPLFELIAVVVQGVPGQDGKWRRRVGDSVVDDYLAAARASKGLLLLNIQPGHSDFLTEAKHFERYLREPDVGIALDPEWAMHGKQKPGVYYGQASGSAINEVGDYLSKIVKENNLPEKVLVFHQVNSWVLKDEDVLTTHPGVAMVKSVDGLGPKGAKVTTYNFLVKTLTPGVHAGFKLFFEEDSSGGRRLMTPDEVLSLAPKPEYVMYE